jgi:hypothetical protein
LIVRFLWHDQAIVLGTSRVKVICLFVPIWRDPYLVRWDAEMNLRPFVLLSLFSSQWLASSFVTANQLSRLEIAVDDVDGNPLPCRIHLMDQQGNAQKADSQPFWHDHFVCSGRVSASVAPGKYGYAIERGPEYLRKTGQVEISAGNDRKLNVTLKRIANLRSAGWYCGDLHVHRPIEEIEQLMQAEDLDFAPVITWWNNRNLWQDQAIPAQRTRQFDQHRVYNIMAGEDEREGGALLYLCNSSEKPDSSTEMFGLISRSHFGGMCLYGWQADR